MSSRIRLLLGMIGPGNYLLLVGFLLLFTVMSVSASGMLPSIFFAIFVFFYPHRIHSDRWDAYRALSLTTSLYLMHRRVLVTAAVMPSVLVGLSLSGWLQGGFPWAWALALLGGWLYGIAKPPKDSWHGRQLVDEAFAPPLPARTPVAEIVWRPQVGAWAGYWGMMLVGGTVILGVNWLQSEGIFAEGLTTEHQWAGMMAPLFFLGPAIGLPMLVSTSGSSLRAWVELGGPRGRWVRETLKIAVGNVLLGMAAVTGMVAFAPLQGAAATTMWMTVGALCITVPPAFYALALVRRTTTGLVSVLTLALVVSVWVCVTLGIDGPVTLALASGTFLFWALSLPTMARHHNVFRAGLAEWFGLRRVGG